jgi:phage-related protein
MVIIVAYILYNSLHSVNKRREGIGKTIRDFGKSTTKGSTDIVNDVQKLSKDVSGALDRIGNIEKNVDNAFNQLQKIQEIPEQISNVAKEVDKFPGMIDRLVEQIEKNINTVDKVTDNLKDVVNVIENEIKDTISKLEDSIEITINEIIKIKSGFLKFINGVGDVFVQVFEIILKLLYFIGDLPKCLIWYIIDAWDVFFRTVSPEWVVWLTHHIFKLIFGISKFILSIFGFDFDIDNKKCYSLNIEKEKDKLKDAFESFEDFFVDIFS